MTTTKERADRRRALLQAVGAPILLMGNGTATRNMRLNTYPFRQDSNFLYFTGCKEPTAALLLTSEGETLFLEPPAVDDALWHGSAPSLDARGAALGMARVAPIADLERSISKLPRPIATLAVPDPQRTAWAARLTGQPLSYPDQLGHERLIQAIISLRRKRSPAEIDEMRAAAAVTARAHERAMAATLPGGHEREIAALFDGVIAAAGMCTAYHSIVTVRGEILHNPTYDNPLEAGQLLLLDGGAEGPGGYASDVTRTWPVSGRFSARQRALYGAVLDAQRASIELVRPGVRYREVHDRSSLVLASFLADEGLLRVAPEDAVAEGAHAIFFPHGVGHLIGLDVHDLEDFGPRATHDPRYPRSDQFGTQWLRIDLDLEPGMVVTVEPGLYLVDAILQNPDFVERYGRFVDFERARGWLGVGGVRIEDDVLVTPEMPEVLTRQIPKTIPELEALIGTRPHSW